MAGTGEVYKRGDGKYAWRLKAGNGEIVATDGNQGYEAASSAKETLQKVIRGDYDGPITGP